MKKQLIGRKCQIVSDNENYDDFKGKLLEITHVAYSTKDHPGYDESCKGQALCNLKVKDTNEAVPFSLYEWEFDLK